MACWRLDAFRLFSQDLIAQAVMAQDVVAQDLVELLLQLQAGPVQAAANRPDRELKDLRDFVVITIINFAEHEDRPVLIAEPVERAPDLNGPLFAEQPIFGLFRVVMRLQTQLVALRIDGRLFAAPATPADRRVNRDAIQPGVKGAAAGERAQLDISLDERFLCDVLGVVKRAANVGQRRAESNLVLADERAEGGGIAIASGPDQLPVVLFHFCTV
jgi:hypothetical protein